MTEPHSPETLPPDDLDWTSFVPLLGEANRKLARFDGILQGMPNPDVLIAPLTDQEAVLSSRIEGTRASLEEVLEHEADPIGEIEPEIRADIQEIINYRNALQEAVESMDDRPLNLNMLKTIHSILLDSVRGKNKARGEFRKKQVFIGKTKKMEDARYVPPEWNEVESLMDNLEKFIHDDAPDVLVQLAMVHAQFEIIHPFLDGNGRVGRILIPLFLFEKELLSKPMFYISEFLEANRSEYYDRLLFITEEGDWEGWIRFFLTSITEQAKANTNRIQSIMDLYEEEKKKITEITGSKYAIQALDAIFQKPIFSSAEFQSVSGIPKRAANRIIKKLLEGKVISMKREKKGRKPGLYHFSHLLDIVREPVF